MTALLLAIAGLGLLALGAVGYAGLRRRLGNAAVVVSAGEDPTTRAAGIVHRQNVAFRANAAARGADRIDLHGALERLRSTTTDAATTNTSASSFPIARVSAAWGEQRAAVLESRSRTGEPSAGVGEQHAPAFEGIAVVQPSGPHSRRIMHLISTLRWLPLRTAQPLGMCSRLLDDLR